MSEMKELLNLLSRYLNFDSKAITINQVNKVLKMGVNPKRAVELLLQNYFGLSAENEIVKDYFPLMINILNKKEYLDDEYYKKIKFPNKKTGHFQMKMDKYDAYEAFVCNDFLQKEDLIIPQIGYFNEPFSYPAIYENNRLWMSVTPNEIETMKKPIKEVFGVVGTIGLGLGYFTYMVSLKTNVKKVIVVEKSKEIIKLFQEYILPQFKEKDKIEILEMDAFTFLDQKIKDYKLDYLFSDIWHDVSDGLVLSSKIKMYEEEYKETNFLYWISETMKHYKEN